MAAPPYLMTTVRPWNSRMYGSASRRVAMSRAGAMAPHSAGLPRPALRSLHLAARIDAQRLPPRDRQRRAADDLAAELTGHRVALRRAGRDGPRRAIAPDLGRPRADR